MPNHTQIVYYDFASVAFVGYYLEGFLQQQQRYGYHLSVARNVPPIFDAMEIDEPRREILLLHRYTRSIHKRISARVPSAVAE